MKIAFHVVVLLIAIMTFLLPTEAFTSGSKIAKKTDSSVENYNLSKKEKVDIFKLLLQEDSGDYGMSDSEVMEAMTAKKISLSGNGLLSLVITVGAPFFCGGSGGNCTMWVLEKNSDNYRLLLTTNGQVIDLEKNITNGYIDISCPSHLGRNSHFKEEQIIEVFKYNGSEYKTAECWAAIDGVKKKRTKCGP